MKKAMDVALDGLSRRTMTEWEIRSSLTKKGFPQEEIKEVLFRLREWNYIDDQQYARIFCQSRMERFSRHRIKEELRLKGVEKEIIGQTLEACYSDETEVKQCKSIAAKLWQGEEKRLIDKERKKAGLFSAPEEERVIQPDELERILRQRVGKKLASRGYSWQTISTVLGEMDDFSSDS